MNKAKLKNNKMENKSLIIFRFFLILFGPAILNYILSKFRKFHQDELRLKGDN